MSDRIYGGKKRAPKPDFVATLAGDPDLDREDLRIVVHEPDGGTVMDVTAPMTGWRECLVLLFGKEQWARAEEYIEAMDAEGPKELLQDIMWHFEVDKLMSPETNRAERRRRGRR